MSTEVYTTIKDQLNVGMTYLRIARSSRVPDTPYTTFFHRDLWAKNIMIKNGTTK